MTLENQQSREIDGDGRTVRQLLANRKYSIDYYQREYKWQKKQLTELLEDLSNKFLESYEETHERSEIDNYGHYFLGSIIISSKADGKFIIDGQQRITTLTLLLIFLRNLLGNSDQQGLLSDLIFSLTRGKRSFNLDVPERTPCMEALYLQNDFIAPDHNESVTNIMARYSDLDELFPDDLRGEALPFFCDWLIENVHLVEITAYSDGDAYTIFETMNDRGLSLTPVDMLKGYLLANISDPSDRVNAGRAWKERVSSLIESGKEEDADCIKAWLRSQHATNIRERKKGAEPKDFDLIGTEFHRWVRDNEKHLDLKSSSDFRHFIDRDFQFYGQWYQRVRNAAISRTPGFETIYYNAAHNFTLQYPVLLAPVAIGDDESLIKKKIGVTAAFLDTFINRRIWNWRTTDYSSMQYAMFNVMKEIRGMALGELVETLWRKLDTEPEKFETNVDFNLHMTNGRSIHRILARMTEFVEVGSGLPSHYEEHAKRGGKDAFEIEHIWANDYEQHEDEFGHQSEFASYRNRVGGLLLLPKSFNASYGALSFKDKLPYYYGQNLLAQSLNEQTYRHNPGFVRFVEETQLPFAPMTDFKKADLDSRQTLYANLAELVWNPDRLKVIADGP